MPKIKGIDYDYLKKLLFESIAAGEDQNIALTKVIKPFVRGSLKKFLKRDFFYKFNQKNTGELINSHFVLVL